jgi:DNA-binding CsgD family transcriptional regulator
MAAAAEALRLHELDGAPLRGLQLAVGASSAMIYRYDERRVPVPIIGALGEPFREYRLDLFLADPLQREARRLPPGPKVVMASQSVPRDLLHKSPAYNEFYRPHGIGSLLCGCLTADRMYGEPGLAGILFARPPGREEFGPADRKMLQTALPVLVGAALRDARVEQMEQLMAVQETILSMALDRPLLALNLRGRLLWASPAAEKKLAPYFIGRRRELPQVLLRDVRDLGEVMRGSELRSPLRVSVELPLPGGESQRAELTVSRTPSGEHIVLAELVEAERPTLGAFAQMRGLTPTEGEILRLMNEGLSTKEMAAQQFVSVETIRTHVQHILRKLAVPNRARAILLVREGTQPTLFR